uniref:Uncharacterized protein n=1 Tax=Acaryochloris marina (strain MBIC 11017) TaxID=329726 RepID=A8ZK72_ACAM1|nr:hypothetical protein [Acaryochloris marina]ABW31572.1 hypothetical protein AM1_A0063 [Acaryochloris marina MBIC11017]
MAADNKYSTVLLELKTHYQETLAELEAQTTQLKTKITSLDTLIEDPLLGSDILSILQGEADSIDSEAPDSTVTNTVEPKAKSKKTTQKAASKKKSATPKKPASTAKTKGTVEPKAEATPKKAAPKASPSSGKRKSSTPKKAVSQATAKKKNQKKTSSPSSSVLTMNKPYDQMKKIDAITQIMQENPGKVMHYDDLIVRLFGELSKDDQKAERGRIKAAMYQGAKNNLWKKANVPMCYIYDPSLQAESKATNSKAQKSRKKT